MSGKTMAEIVFAIIGFLFTQQFPHVVADEKYVRCLSCFDVASPLHCRTSLTCGQGEMCYVRKFTDHRGLQGFHLGCEDKAICNIFINAKFLLGKRDIASASPDKCFECCSGTNCNARLCGGGNGGQILSSTASTKSSSTTTFTSKPTTSTTKTTTTLTTTASPTTTLPTTTSSPCPGSFVPFQDSCYLFVYNPDYFHAAQKFCQTLSAHLVIVNSQSEQDFLNNNYKQCVDGSVWLGAEYSHGYHWVDGSPLHYTNWYSHLEQKYPLVLMWNPCFYSNHDDTGGKWYTTTSFAKLPYICEMEKA